MPHESSVSSRPKCPGGQRHWFTVRGHVGLRSPICISCGMTNPATLTTDDWWKLLDVAPALLERAGFDPVRLREQMEDERERGFGD